MIECGLGVGFLPLHLAQPFCDSGSLWRLPPYEDAPQAPIHIITNPAIELSPAETVLLNSLSGNEETIPPAS